MNEQHEISVDDPSTEISLASNEVAISRPLEARERSRSLRLYIVLPLVFLTVALFGGMRFAAADNSFIFLAPPLICSIFGAVTVTLLFRSRLLRLNAWFSDSHPLLENFANAGLVFTLFAACVQVYNLLLPEQGLANWVFAALFLWTLWNDLVIDLDPKKLFRSLAGLFSIAFITKYLILANLAVPAEGNWLQRLLADPGRQAATWFLDLPSYSAATGYLHFFTLILFLVGLFLTPQDPRPIAINAPKKG